ncbi:MAG TPA: aspartate carbamoyltransferase [Spirochaetia bacterium]|nr:aspartate carbamoyltransferase [Spirochaetia bacterium]
MSTNFCDRDIISITDFSREEILHLCEAGQRMALLEKTGERNTLRDALKYRTLSYMFYEPSTRTRTSFNTGMRELGGRYDGFSGTEGTSVMKSETVRDTVTMMCANHNDVIVMRHPLDGSLQWAADVANIPVINGGDGKNEHPTQALLDVLTIYALKQGRLDGIRVGFGGDLSHGRTVRSLSLALSHFDNVTIRWAAEDFLGMPDDLSHLLASRGVRVQRERTVRDVMGQVDFYYMTRPQLERMPGVTQKDIAVMMKQYRIDPAKVEGFDVRVLHPLPVNSEIAEIDYRVYFTPAQAFFTQAEFGVFLRKALLHEMLGHEGYQRYNGRLPAELGTGNNRLPRGIRGAKQSAMFIDKIHDGTVIDHLAPGSLRAVSDALDLENRGYSCTTATIPEKRNPFIKTNLPDPSERDLKTIALLSPDPTIDTIVGGRIAAKFVYLLCSNTNCITRVVNEDVPPRFYRDHDAVRCRYCRRQYTIASRKVSDGEKSSWIASLPGRIEPVAYPD